MADTELGGVPREQKMLTGHLPRVIYHQVYQYTKINPKPLCGPAGDPTRVRERESEKERRRERERERARKRERERARP